MRNKENEDRGKIHHHHDQQQQQHYSGSTSAHAHNLKEKVGSQQDWSQSPVTHTNGIHSILPTREVGGVHSQLYAKPSKTQEMIF